MVGANLGGAQSSLQCAGRSLLLVCVCARCVQGVGRVCFMLRGLMLVVDDVPASESLLRLMMHDLLSALARSWSFSLSYGGRGDPTEGAAFGQDLDVTGGVVSVQVSGAQQV